MNRMKYNRHYKTINVLHAGMLEKERERKGKIQEAEDLGMVAFALDIQNKQTRKWASVVEA